MALEQVRRRSTPWVIVLLSLLGALLIVGALALWGGLQAIERGWVSGPTITLKVGTFHMIAKTTDRPQCIFLPLQECMISFPMANSRPLTYAIWAGHITSVPASGYSTAYTVSSGRMLFLTVLRQLPQL